MKKNEPRQRAHPENAPQCHICGRICSTTWNLKQHIEKHYDIHPQKGVLKKKTDDNRIQLPGQIQQPAATHLGGLIAGTGAFKTQDSVQIETQIQVSTLPLKLNLKLDLASTAASSGCGKFARSRNTRNISSSSSD